MPTENLADRRSLESKGREPSIQAAAPNMDCRYSHCCEWELGGVEEQEWLLGVRGRVFGSFLWITNAKNVFWGEKDMYTTSEENLAITVGPESLTERPDKRLGGREM